MNYLKNDIDNYFYGLSSKSSQPYQKNINKNDIKIVGRVT